jgi:hypothetical protein
MLLVRLHPTRINIQWKINIQDVQQLFVLIR